MCVSACVDYRGEGAAECSIPYAVGVLMKESGTIGTPGGVRWLAGSSSVGVECMHRSLSETTKHICRRNYRTVRQTKAGLSRQLTHPLSKTDIQHCPVLVPSAVLPCTHSALPPQCSVSFSCYIWWMYHCLEQQYHPLCYLDTTSTQLHTTIHACMCWTSSSEVSMEGSVFLCTFLYLLALFSAVLRYYTF